MPVGSTSRELASSFASLCAGTLESSQPSGVLDQVRVLVARKTSKAPLDVRVTIDEEEPAEVNQEQRFRFVPP